MKEKSLGSGILAALLFVIASSPVLAGGPGPYNVSADCGGGGQMFTGGDVVPFTLRLENQTLSSLSLNMQMRLNVPGLGTLNLFQTGLMLGPNQDLAIDRALTLPAVVPAGDWTIIMIASGAGFATFDTCSFNVVS